MNIRELYDYLNDIIPPSLSSEWDNDGLMCCPDPDREVRRVLVALDVTDTVADTAIEEGFDLIVSHHPMIFRPIKALADEKGVEGRIVRLIRAGIGVMSFHTRLDAVDGGVNDVLAELLGLDYVVPFGEGQDMCGRIGRLPRALHLDDFARQVKKALGAPGVIVSGCGKPVSHVAVLGGSGSDFLSAAKAAGADTFVTGELRYHHLSDAPDIGMNLIVAGHFYTEDPVCDRLIELINEADETIECVYIKSCLPTIL